MISCGHWGLWSGNVQFVSRVTCELLAKTCDIAVKQDLLILLPWVPTDFDFEELRYHGLK